MRALKTVPRPLLGLLAAVLALGIAFTLVSPFLQAPDENSHFGYVQYFGETGHLPGHKVGAAAFTTEQTGAALASNSDQAAAEKDVPMTWSKDIFERWRAQDRAFTKLQRSDAGGPGNPAATNPPLYYLVETPSYLVGKGGDVFTRLELTRLESVLWVLVTTLGAWLLAGELFGLDRLMQLAVAGFTGLAPEILFVSSSVSPDGMLYATWAFALWLGVRMLRRPLTLTAVLALFGVVGIACVVKATSYALFPGAAVALGLALLRDRSQLSVVRVVKTGAVAAAGLVFTLGIWIAVSRLNHQAAAAQVGVVSSGQVNIREFLSYLWQFYLPKLGFMTNFRSVAPTLPFWDIEFKGAWASFGWLEVIFPAWVYLVLLAGSAAAMVGAFGGLLRDRARIDWRVAAYLAVVVVSLYAGLHISEYRQLKGGASNFFQGRYVLPLAPLAACALARTIAWAPQRLRGQVVGGTLAVFLVLNLFAFGLILQRFYA